MTFQTITVEFTFNKESQESEDPGVVAVTSLIPDSAPTLVDFKNAINEFLKYKQQDLKFVQLVDQGKKIIINDQRKLVDGCKLLLHTMPSTAAATAATAAAGGTTSSAAVDREYLDHALKEALKGIPSRRSIAEMFNELKMQDENLPTCSFSQLQTNFARKTNAKKVLEILDLRGFNLQPAVLSRTRTARNSLPVTIDSHKQPRDCEFKNEDGDVHNTFIRVIHKIFTDKDLQNHYTLSKNPNPPRGEPDEDGFYERMLITARTLKHTFRTPCIGTQKPDFIVYDNRLRLSSASITTIVEMYLNESDETSHFIKLVLYHEQILRAQLTRNFIVSIISSMNYVTFVKSRRVDGSFEHTYSESVKLNAEDNLIYVVELLTNDKINGYVSGLYQFVDEQERTMSDAKKMNLLPELFLGQGRTSNVFSVRGKDDLVCKIVNNKKQFEFEIEALRTLGPKSKTFLQLVGVSANDQAFVARPRGELKTNLSPARQVNRVRQQFECLQTLSKAGWVQRDMVSKHFLEVTTSEPVAGAESKSDQFFLIDFGFALPQYTSAEFAGSANYAPAELLKYIYEQDTVDGVISPKKYQVQCWHDWHTMINCLSLDLHGGVCDIRRRIEKLQIKPKDEKNCKQLEQFWLEYYKKFTCCGSIVAMCKTTVGPDNKLVKNAQGIFDQISERFQQHFKEEMDPLEAIFQKCP